MQIMNKKSGICYDAIYFDKDIFPYPDGCQMNRKASTGYSYLTLDKLTKIVICEDGTIYDVEFIDGFEIWFQSWILTNSDGIRFPITRQEKEKEYEDI